MKLKDPYFGLADDTLMVQRKGVVDPRSFVKGRPSVGIISSPSFGVLGKILMVVSTSGPSTLVKKICNQMYYYADGMEHLSKTKSV